MNTKTAAPTFVADTTVHVGEQSRRERLQIGLNLSDALRVLSGDFTPLAEIITQTWGRLDVEITHAWFGLEDMVFLTNERILRQRQEWEDNA